MQGESILQTIAEVSVAFAGFTGVAVALGRRSDDDAGSAEAYAFGSMLAASLMALLFAVLPFLLEASGVPEPSLWRVASGFMFLGTFGGAATDVHFVRRRFRGDPTPLDRFLYVVIPIGGITSMLAQTANVLGFVDRAFAPYLGGLIFFLFFSSMMFVRLLTQPRRAAP